MMFPLFGNEHIEKVLSNAFSSNRIPHALMIEGETGQGKHTLADYIACAAVCSGENIPCGECVACKKAKGKNHPDIIYVAPEKDKKSISVDQIRDLRASAFIKPHEAQRKVYIIESADTLLPPAQNALLKILEEPPQGVVFILLTVSRTAMLPTVNSRCVLLSLANPTPQKALEIIKEQVKKYSDEAILAALSDSHGVIGAALSLLKGSKAGKAASAAKEFIELIFSGGEYDLLLFLEKNIKKDRIFAENFYSQLQTRALDEIKSGGAEGRRARVLFALYENTKKYKESLKTNINLSLLESSTVADIRSITK